MITAELTNTACSLLSNGWHRHLHVFHWKPVIIAVNWLLVASLCTGVCILLLNSLTALEKEGAAQKSMILFSFYLLGPCAYFCFSLAGSGVRLCLPDYMSLYHVTKTLIFEQKCGSFEKGNTNRYTICYMGIMHRPRAAARSWDHVAAIPLSPLLKGALTSAFQGGGLQPTTLESTVLDGCVV